MNWIDYEWRLAQVRAYMHAHLDDDLDLRTLAEVASLSPYHWHRIYQAFYGETAASTVKRLRMHRAAGLIAQSDLTIHEIAARSGYLNLQSFTRIFSEVFGMPPARYRQTGNHVPFQTDVPALPEGSYPVCIETSAPFTLVAAEHIGPYMSVNEAFDRVDGWLRTENITPASPKMVGLYFDDPFVTDEQTLRSMAGVILAEPPALPPGLVPLPVRGGLYAVLRYQGPYAGMHAAYRWLFGVWVIASGYAVDDAPLVEVYCNDPATTAPNGLITEIRLPIRSTMLADSQNGDEQE